MESPAETPRDDVMLFATQISLRFDMGDRLKNSVGKTHSELSRLAREFAEEVISDNQSEIMQKLRTALALTFIDQTRSIERDDGNDQRRIVEGLVNHFVETSTH